MILTLLSHIAAVRILLIVGIAFIALPIFFYKLSGSGSEKLKSLRNWAVFAGVLMCMPMLIYLYEDHKYGLSDYSANDKLFLAAENRNMSAARLFINEGGQPCGVTRYKKTAAERAVELNNAEMTDLFLDCAINPNFTGDGKVTLLGIAAGNLCPETVKVLLDARADPDYLPDRCIPALHMAAMNDLEYHSDIVKMLLDAGADPASKTVQNGKVMLPYRYYYDTHKADEETITEEEELRFGEIKEMLYRPYIEWLNEKMTAENEVAE